MMDNSQELQKLFTRRALLVGAGQISVLGLLIGRMAQLQIFKHDKYVTLAEDNRINTTLLPPERGLITDRYGVPLAENRQSYRLLYVPERGEKIDTILQELNGLIKWQPHQIERIKRDMARQSRRRIFDMLVNEKMMAGGFHFPFPAFGSITPSGNGYQFVPVA